jgi:hypothetical protein
VNIVFWLGRLASQFGMWASSLDGVGNSIANVPILGPYLSGAFRFGGDRMRQAFSDTVQVQFQASEIVIRLSVLLSDLLAFAPIRSYVNSLLAFIQDPGGAVLNYIAGRVYHWTQFWSDPVGWLRTRLQSLGGTVSQWLNDPAGWVRDRLTTAYGHVSQLLTDPTGWLRARVFALAGHVSQFLNDPFGFVRGYFLALAPDLQLFLTFPAGWVRDRLMAATGLTLAFLSDPFGFVRDRLFLLYPALNTFLVAPGAFVVNAFMDGVETTLDVYKARLLKVAERVLASVF